MRIPLSPDSVHSAHRMYCTASLGGSIAGGLISLVPDVVTDPVEFLAAFAVVGGGVGRGDEYVVLRAGDGDYGAGAGADGLSAGCRAVVVLDVILAALDNGRHVDTPVLQQHLWTQPKSGQLLLAYGRLGV